MPRLNLLPADIRGRQRVRRILSAITAAGVVFIAFLGLLYTLQRGTIRDEEDTLRQSQVEAARLRGRVASLQQFADLQRQFEQSRGTLASALAGEVAWSKLLNDLSLIMPDNSWLVNLSLNAAPGQAPTGVPSFGQTTFQGFVFDFPGLAGWLTRMAQIDGLTFVYLTSGARQEVEGRPVVSFGASASITQALLSQRCQAGKPCP